MYCLLKWIKFSVKKTKHKKNTGKLEKNTGKVREFCQSGKVGTLMTQSERKTRRINFSFLQSFGNAMTGKQG